MNQKHAFIAIDHLANISTFVSRLEDLDWNIVSTDEVHLADMVVVNFREFTKNPCVRAIDIDRPTMLRAAAKDYRRIIVIVDPSDYDTVLDELTLRGDVSLMTRQTLAGKAFYTMAQYDLAIANTFATYNDQMTELPMGAY